MTPEISHRLDAFRHLVFRTAAFEEGEFDMRKSELVESYALRLRQTKQDPFSTVIRIKELRTDLEKNVGKEVSPLLVAAAYIGRLATDDLLNVNTQLEIWDTRNPDYDLLGKMVIKYDGGMGMVYVSDSLRLAEGELSKGADGISKEVIDQYGEHGTEKPSISEGANMYQKLISLSRTYSRLLRQDRNPTEIGFGLVDYIVARYKSSEEILEPIPHYMNREIVALGTEHAADLFKVLSPLAQK